MKKYFGLIFIILVLPMVLCAQSEAGAIWLLINPGARATGMGETGAAISNDAYATYYNAAGLGFLQGREISVMHTNWLPNLASDLYYDFIAYRHYVRNVGSIGGNIVIMNLGTQLAMDERGNPLGEFTSYMMAATASYGTRLSRTTAFGMNVKMVHQHLTDILAGAEKGKGQSTNFAFDLGYLKREFLLRNLTLGASISNIGPKIAFIDVAQADPMPTNLKLGFKYEIGGKYNRITIAYDVNKLMVASYPDRDIDGDARIGGYDESGNPMPGGEYNENGQHEFAHSDPWYKGIFTSWVDDWFLLYDAKVSNEDGVGKDRGDGKNKWGELADSDGDLADGSLGKELEKLVHNFGIEYWYSNLFAIRVGFLYDKPGKILMNNKWPVPTFGAGLRYAGMGFDFGYTSGDAGHPRANTMHFSLNLKF